MNQARKKNGEWVEVEERTDGVYANGVKIANPYGEIEDKNYKQLEYISL